MVLVDTSVWIDLLRSNDTTAVRRLRQLLDLGVVFVAPVIVQELLQGASSERNLQILRDRFIVLPRPRGRQSTMGLSCYTMTGISTGWLKSSQG
jgi:predicted nucleic acid-binding protein